MKYIRRAGGDAAGDCERHSFSEQHWAHLRTGSQARDQRC
jgi:hypothetical protein